MGDRQLNRWNAAEALVGLLIRRLGLESGPGMGWSHLRSSTVDLDPANVGRFLGFQSNFGDVLYGSFPLSWSLIRILAYWRHLLYYSLVRRRQDAHRLALIAQSSLFDSNYYLEQNPDVAAAGIDPVIHYVDFGAAELRNPSPFFDTARYAYAKRQELEGGENPLLHLIRINRDAIAAHAPISRTPPEDAVSIYQSYAPRTESGRLVVYTAVVGAYDTLVPPQYFPPNCDFVVFSDEPMVVEGWTTRPLGYMHQDSSRSARFVKLHPHFFFAEYEYSIWLDANIGVIGNVAAFIEQLRSGNFISSFIHPLRNCIFEEGAECIVRKKDDELTILQQLERYRTLRVPEHGGLWETNCLVRRHNDPACIKLMTSWWQELDRGSKRDQLSLPVVARTHSAAIVPLDRPGVSARAHPLLTYSPHRKGHGSVAPVCNYPTIPQGSRALRPSTTLGICVHGNLSEVRKCLDAAALCCAADDQILIVDDASDTETQQYLEAFVADHRQARLVRNPKNLGYTRSANVILRSAATDWIVLLNSDAVLLPEALTKLIAAGEEQSRLAVVGPLSNAAGWQTVPQLAGPTGSFLLNEIPARLTLSDMDALCERARLPSVQLVPLVNGFCFVVRRHALRDIGIFDEENFPYGYGEEDDFCLRAWNAGYSCGIATNVYVHHSKTRSFTHARRTALTNAGQIKLREKHTRERVDLAVRAMSDHPGLRAVRNKISKHLAHPQQKLRAP